MASSIAWRNIPRTSNPLVVLDPMAGSGTTLIAAQSKGHQAIGFDRDPLAVVMAKVWCSRPNLKQIERATSAVMTDTKKWRTIPLSTAYPDGADEETKAFVRYWFDDTNRRQLAALSRAINGQGNAPIRAVLWCALSRLIITKVRGVSLAMDVSHSRPHKTYHRAIIHPLDKFVSSVNTILKMIPSQCSSVPSARVQLGDARNLPIENNTVNLVITSPPYLDAIDYLRGHKFSLVWMGHSISELRAIRATNIGRTISRTNKCNSLRYLEVINKMTHVDTLSTRTRGMLYNYVRDMERAVKEIARVLVPGGKALFVIGDSTVRGSFIKNSSAVTELVQLHGLTITGKRSRILPSNRRYLPPPTLRSSGTKLQSRMRNEVLISTEKTG